MVQGFQNQFSKQGIDLSWSILTHLDPLRTILTYIDLSWPILTYFDLSWPISTYFHLYWEILTYLVLSRTILTYLDLPWPPGKLRILCMIMLDRMNLDMFKIEKILMPADPLGYPPKISMPCNIRIISLVITSLCCEQECNYSKDLSK